MGMDSIADLVKTLLFVTAILIVLALLGKLTETHLSGSPRLIDGDSLVLDGQEIRLKGIDAPELNQQCRRSASQGQYACGRTALTKLRNLTKGRSVKCEGRNYDKYDRLLATCWAGDININREMVTSGWAVSFGNYQEEEELASNQKRGLWAGEFQSPSKWRRDTRQNNTWDWLSSLLSLVF